MKQLYFLSFFLCVTSVLNGMQLAIVDSNQAECSSKVMLRHNTPAYQAYELANAINREQYDKALNMLLNTNTLKSYGPAIVLREVIQAKVSNFSPFASRDDWNNYFTAGIKKQNFFDCSLYIVETMEKSYEDNYRMAQRYFMARKHLKKLPSKEWVHAMEKFAQAVKNNNYSEVSRIVCREELLFSEQVVVILKEVVGHKISSMSPFFNQENWWSYTPAYGISKSNLLDAALYIICKKVSHYKEQSANENSKRDVSKLIAYYQKWGERLLRLR